MPAFDFVLAGRYRLIGPLGEGGMATVYRGRDLRLNREVAIKLLREDLTRDPGFLRRFQQEAQFVASLSHPNIVPVYDVGEEDGSHFIVMEYIRGRTLKELLESGGPMSSERACAVMLQMLDALACAHGQGLIHRDVKPHNVLMTADGTARLADFGIAHLADGSTTRTAAILGSAQYLSPEQSRGEEATERSDIYACGVVLYEMLSGSAPFNGANALAIANQHLNAPPPPLGRSSPGIGADLESAVMTALAKDPSDRFPDAHSMSAALKSASPSTSATSVQPLRVVEAPEQTSPQPLTVPASRGATLGSVEIVDDAGPAAHPLGRGAEKDRLEIRRSARKVYITGVVLLVLVLGFAYGANRPPIVQSLPQYPSAGYGLIPAGLLVILVLAWMNTRSWLYTMDTNAAVVHWGLFGHHRFGVPVRFITTLELKQSPLDRILGVGTVEMTARDQHGRERHITLEDLPHPKRTYDALMLHLGKTVRRV